MKDWSIRTIVLGYDGSQGADRAASLASALARQNNAKIFVVTAFEVRYRAGDLGERGARTITAAEETSQELTLKLRELGINAEADVLEGAAGDVLLSVAETRGADLVVVGRRGRGPIVGLLLGSTSEFVLRRAKVPVLVAH